MSVYGRQAYLESEVLQAEPVHLIRLLYKGALEAVRQARQHLRAGRIAERSNQITRAMEILGELGQSLDLERGGSVAVNLSRLYDYMNQRLQDANFEQAEPPLSEVEGLLSTLAEAWEDCPATETTAPSATPAQVSSWAVDDAYASYTPQTFGRY